MRKVTEVVLMDGGEERHFEIQQMSASKQERWINKALTLIVSKNANHMSSIFNNFTEQEKQEKSANEVAMAVRSGNLETLLSLLNDINYDDIEPLYNDLLECVSYLPNLDNKNFKTQLNINTVDAIIDDVRTLYKLRLESFKLNFSFFTEDDDQSSQTGRSTTSISIPKNTRM